MQGYPLTSTSLSKEHQEMQSRATQGPLGRAEQQSVQIDACGFHTLLQNIAGKSAPGQGDRHGQLVDQLKL